MGIGERLREAREANQLSLDDIQETTKIQKRYLVAIEQEDYHALPGRFYARAFIKEYANAVGLDVEELLSDFNEDKIEMKDEESVQYTRLKRTKKEGTSKNSIFSLLPTVIVVLLIVSIIFVAWTLYQKNLTGNNDEVDHDETDEIIRNVDENKGDDDVEDDTADDDANEDSDDTEDEETDDEAAFSVVEVGTGNSPESTVEFGPIGDSVEVTLEANADTYLDVKGGSKKTYYSNMFTSDMKEVLDVSDEDRIYFNVGNTAGLTITINGVELEYPIDTATAHQKIWVNLK